MSRTNDNTANRLEIVEVARAEDVTRIVLAGDLDLAAAPALRRLLAKECSVQPLKVVLDLSALEFVDSAGLSTFVRADKALSADGGTLMLSGASERVRRLLEITSLSHLLEDGHPSPNGRRSLVERAAELADPLAGEDARSACA